MTTLAISDNWIIGSFCLQMVVNVGLVLFLAYLKHRNDQTRALQDENKRQAEEIFNAKMTTVAERFSAMVEALKTELDRVVARLAKGDVDLSKLAGHDHQQEIKFVQAIEGLQRDMIERFASRKELLELMREVRSIELKCAECRRAAS
jgi:Mg2+ and Co2+ transporter CorA